MIKLMSHPTLQNHVPRPPHRFARPWRLGALLRYFSQVPWYADTRSALAQASGASQAAHELPAVLPSLLQLRQFWGNGAGGLIGRVRQGGLGDPLGESCS